MVTITLPEALPLIFINQRLGEEAVNVLIEKKQSLYDKNRYNESNAEPQ